MNRPASAGGLGASPSSTSAAWRLSESNGNSGPVLQLLVGDRVTHEKFGVGTVLSTAGTGDKSEATIDFGSAGEKRLLLRYAPVEKL